MPFNEGHQNPGNPIPASGWNNMVDEIKRLGTAKLETAGGIVNGPLALQQSLSVTGNASLGSAAVGGALAVAGAATLASASVRGGVTVQGAASIAGTATLGSARVGSGAGGPQDTLDVAGIMRVGVGPAQLRFTSPAWTGFPDSSTTQAEICNDTVSFKGLMIVGNRAAGDNLRRVGLWDVVSIGSTGTTAGKLEVNGQSCARSFCNLSDGRLKSDVAPITDSLRRISRLRGVSFRWRDERDLSQSPRSSAGAPAAGTAAAPSGSPREATPPLLGVVAQEVAAVFPELISTIGEQGHLGVDYGGLTAVLIEAVKQLAASNEELRQRVAALEALDPPAA